MEDEAWRSISVVDDAKGEPHVIQQKVRVLTSGMSEESAGYTRPLNKHRLVPMKNLVSL